LQQFKDRLSGIDVCGKDETGSSNKSSLSHLVEKIIQSLTFYFHTPFFSWLLLFDKPSLLGFTRSFCFFGIPQFYLLGLCVSRFFGRRARLYDWQH
jgi:hypothetical protein